MRRVADRVDFVERVNAASARAYRWPADADLAAHAVAAIEIWRAAHDSEISPDCARLLHRAAAELVGQYTEVRRIRDDRADDERTLRP